MVLLSWLLLSRGGGWHGADQASYIPGVITQSSLGFRVRPLPRKGIGVQDSMMDCWRAMVTDVDAPAF